MKSIQLKAVSLAVLASTVMLGAQSAQAFSYDQNGYIVRDTGTGVIGSTLAGLKTVVTPNAISAEAGSLGYGARIGWELNPTVEFQAGWAGGDVADLFGGDFDVDDIEYDVDSDFSNPYLGVQVRPGAGAFTMSAGVIVPDNEININANSKNGVYRIGDRNFSANNVGSLRGSVEHRNELAPYLTIGYSPRITQNIAVFGEIGAAYLGEVNSNVTASGNNAEAQAAAAAANEELQNEDYLEILPIVKLGATYRF